MLAAKGKALSEVGRWGGNAGRTAWHHTIGINYQTALKRHNFGNKWQWFCRNGRNQTVTRHGTLAGIHLHHAGFTGGQSLMFMPAISILALLILMAAICWLASKANELDAKPTQAMIIASISVASRMRFIT